MSDEREDIIAPQHEEAAQIDPARARDDDDDAAPAPRLGAKRVQLIIVSGVAVVLLLIGALYLRAAARTNHVALADAPKPVSVQKAQSTTFRPLRTYVGTTFAWNVAKVGPQYVSAYIGSVLVRPGSVVKAGQVLATLDCRNASAASKEIAARAKALEQRQLAVAHESERTKQLTAGGFASENQVEQLTARAAAEAADVESLRAALVGKGLEVDDCILRAPFAGEVAERYADPGAYARPNSPIVSVIDRNTLRIAADAPESDFTVVAPGTDVTIEVEATGAKTTAKISRRAPAADEVTRTVHFEIDVPNADRQLPANATARLGIDVGAPQPATSVPLSSATVRGEKATLFVVDRAGSLNPTTGKPIDHDVARRTPAVVLGERRGVLYLDPKLPAGALVVVEGRALLADGDQVTAKDITP